MKGLTNLGNTCYLNAALQCLLYSPPLTNYVLSGMAEQDLHKKRVNACSLANEYISLAKAYWTRADPAVVDTRGVWAALAKLHRPFSNSNPQDAHEALTLLLRHLHDALAKTPRVEPSSAWAHVDRPAWEAQCAKEGYSMLTELFQGQLECTVTGPGQYTSVTHEHFTGLSLDLQGCATVQQALARCTEDVQIEGYALPTSDATPATHTVTQARRFRYMPLVLVVHLKRFVDPAGDKVDRFVDYSTTLEAGGCRYRLFCACLHSDGHYTAVCEVHDHWFLCDDAACTPVDVNAVVQKDAYVLVYKKLE